MAEPVFVFIQHGDGVGAEIVCGGHSALRTFFINSMWSGDHDEAPPEILREANIVGNRDHEDWGGFPRSLQFGYEDGCIEIYELTSPKSQYPGSLPDGFITPRYPVQQFARWMELNLSLNDHKSGWMSDKAPALLRRLSEEIMELAEAVHRERHPDPRIQSHEAIQLVREAADVANFAMMIAQNASSYTFQMNVVTMKTLRDQAFEAREEATKKAS